ncbi:Cytochrome-P450 monooxygenase-like protein [Teratosphaeria destructans]|uniref:Cytochrome-P450 monooxygenase-like protein n=1 Tax=Teratosphaeria destructans TaxID=418781 RepID=A0A9W7SY93_9PEZI|nr:Cytochrome-P450 monooxygenase-like protein [Teratosphaeria destructans]
MLSVTTTLGVLALLYCVAVGYRLLRNLYIARRTGFPCIVIPWDQNNILWMVIGVPLRAHLQKWLPRLLFKRLTLTIYGWEYHERMRPYDDFCGRHQNGKSFIMVTCGKPEFSTADRDIAYEMLRRPRDFPQTDLAATFTDHFGPSVITSGGDHWTRQRKVVASAVNERISRAVFSESLRQTEGLLDEVFRRSSGNGISAESNEIFVMIKRIAMHVLSGAGMGVNVGWDDSATEIPKDGFKTTYLTAVRCLTDNLSGPIILPQWFLSYYPSFLPGYDNLRTLSYALQEFPLHTSGLLAEERKRLSTCKEEKPRSTFLSQLVQAIDGESKAGNKQMGLTEGEIMGNLFLFTAAGFETTANTMTSGLVLLARHPEWQDWLLEEIDQVLDANTTTEQLEYTAVYPKLTRLLAFMFETLRFYPPLIHLPKQTDTEQTLTTSSGTYTIPAHTTCYINVVAIGLDPDVYRNINLGAGDEPREEDELHFRPSRWVNPAGSAHPHFQVPKGSFLPWSTGPRVCPGQKMAQVEFCAVVLALLREHRVEAVPKAGESRRDVEARLDAAIKDSASVPTLQMDGVYDAEAGAGIPLRLRKRTVR